MLEAPGKADNTHVSKVTCILHVKGVVDLPLVPCLQLASPLCPAVGASVQSFGVGACVSVGGV